MTVHHIIDADPDGPNAGPATSPKFDPGQILATPGALAVLEEHQCTPLSLLARHLAGDWGDVPAEDAKLNDNALIVGGRLLSSYTIGGNARIWIISEADRSSTTLLQPAEY